MARSNFGPEVKAAMAEKSKGVPKRVKPDGPGDTPAEMARDAKRGIVEGSPQDEALDAKQAGPRGPTGSSGQIGLSHPPSPGSVAQSNGVSQMHAGGSPAHAAIAAGIAHAILQGGR